MGIYAVQCAVGPVGGKPVTQLSYASGPFLGLVETNGFAYVFNEGGAWQLNYDDKDDETDITYRLVLNTNFGKRGNVKKLVYVWVTLKGPCDYMEILTKPDTGGCLGNFALPATDTEGFYHWNRCTPHQRGVKAAVGSRLQGEYWAIGLESKQPFTLLGISASFITRPSGISNGVPV